MARLTRQHQQQLDRFTEHINEMHTKKARGIPPSLEDVEKVSEISRGLQDILDSRVLDEMISSLGGATSAPPVSGAGAGGRSGPYSFGGGLGAAFVGSEQFRAFKSAPRPQSWTTGAIQVKAAITDDDGNTVLTEGSDAAGNYTSGGGGKLPQPDVQPGVFLPGLQPATVRGLLAQQPTTSTPVRVLKLTAEANNATGTHEGANKPAGTMTFNATDEPVKKVAVVLPASDEILDDVAQLRAVIDTRLRQWVELETDDEILNGTGGNDLVGILGRTPPSFDASTVTNLFDAIAHAITAVQSSAFMNPDALVINPHDAVDLLTMKSTTSGDYYSGGPYRATTAGPFGLRQVTTTAIAAGNVLVGAFRQGGTVYQRTALTVEASSSHEDYFARNMTMIRAEERLALAVPDVNAFCLVTNAS